MRTKGRITSWHDEKGYGFITPLEGGKQVFVHIKAFSNKNRRPEINEIVSYSISMDSQGRPCAANATLAGDKLVEKAPGKRNASALLFAVVFVVAVGTSAVAGHIPVAVAVVYLAVSLVTYVAYALDKSAAKRGAWRTSEGALLLLGLAGGWPGALIAQQTLRHKSKKASFRVVFWATVLINCAVLAWLHTDSARQSLPGILT